MLWSNRSLGITWCDFVNVIHVFIGVDVPLQSVVVTMNKYKEKFFYIAFWMANMKLLFGNLTNCDNQELTRQYHLYLCLYTHTP